MVRFRHALIVAFLASTVVGCGGESQPNPPATTADVTNPDFGKNAADMMKKANSGMSKDAAKKN
jgi:PBP1b-binding outer membrane lipoprotein LpoB